MQQVREAPGAAWLRGHVLYGNVLVGGIAVCFVLGTYALLGLPPSLPLLGLAFSGTFLVYQAERALYPALEDRFNHGERLAWVGRHRQYVRWSSGLALVLALAMLPRLRPETLAAGSVLALISLLYMAPMLPGRRRLKAWWYLKPVTIAGAWAVGGVLLPVLEAGAAVGGVLPALLVYRLLFVLPNALLADWPDRAGDARAGLCTVATRLSRRRLRGMGAVALALGPVAALGALPALPAPWLLGVDLVGLGLMFALVIRPWPASRLFYGFALDLVVAWPGVTALCAIAC